MLLCGGTGDLGHRIAVRLAAHGVEFRALVRAGSDAAALRALGAHVVAGDLTDRASLDRALAGVQTVVTSANAMARLLEGRKDVSIAAVDHRGNENLVRGAVASGVERFLFVSMAGLTDEAARRAPFAAAKRHTEQLLEASTMRSIIVRPDRYQEIWLSPAVGIDPAKRRAVIFGRGRTPDTYVAADDVAEACVRLCLLDNPPAEIDFGGPERLTRHEVVDAFERGTGAHFRRFSVPRPLLAAGARMARSRKPEIASLMAMALAADIEAPAVSAEPLRNLGIEPRSALDHIAVLTRAAGGRQRGSSAG